MLPGGGSHSPAAPHSLHVTAKCQRRHYQFPNARGLSQPGRTLGPGSTEICHAGTPTHSGSSGRNHESGVLLALGRHVSALPWQFVGLNFNSARTYRGWAALVQRQRRISALHTHDEERATIPGLVEKRLKALIWVRRLSRADAAASLTMLRNRSWCSS